MLNLARRHAIESAYDAAAHRAGWLLLATAAATAVAVVARVSAGADLPTLADSLAAIARRRGLYGAGGAARLVSGITLFAGAWYLWHTRFMRRRLGTLLVPVLLAVSGLFTAVSGASAAALALIAPAPAAAAEVAAQGGAVAMVAELRWIGGRLGFTLAGLALLANAARQWRRGGTLRRLAPATALVGAAMQLIWVDAATVLHRFTGPLFMVWLALIGFMLASGRVGRRIAGSTARRRRPARVRRTG
ncbi:MAG: hypothetical protein OXH96_09710 [Spirochaetaceae bacterium]|nr:hypothetical protein [Spirochaetaceae bacterium]